MQEKLRKERTLPAVSGFADCNLLSAASCRGRQSAVCGQPQAKGAERFAVGSRSLMQCLRHEGDDVRLDPRPNPFHMIAIV